MYDDEEVDHEDPRDVPVDYDDLEREAEAVQEMLCKMIEKEVKDADRPESEIIAIWHEAVQNVMLGLISSKKTGRLSL